MPRNFPAGDANDIPGWFRRWLESGIEGAQFENFGELRPGFTSVSSISEIPLAISPKGQFLFTQYDATYGSFQSRLAVGNGSVTAIANKVSIPATEATGGSPLKNKAGGTSFTAASIIGAWWIDDTRFLFASRVIGGGLDKCCFLFLCYYNGSAWVVGNNVGTWDNRQAVLDVGTTAGASVADNIFLHCRSLDTNARYLPAAAAAVWQVVTVTASPMTWTNSNPYPVEIAISAATAVTALTITRQGTTKSVGISTGETGTTLVLQPQDAMTVTYTGSPAISALPLLGTTPNAAMVVCGDYNVATSRVNGGAKDQVQTYVSYDGGATFATLLSFNTSGNQIRHLHTVKYDRYTGDWYFLFGDAPTNCIVRWDGKSPAPPANTALTQAGIGSYAGWDVLSGHILYEAGDLAIHAETISYLPDDVGPSAAGREGKLRTVLVGREHPMAALFGPAIDWDVTNNRARAPLICVETPGSGSIWASLRDASVDTTPGYDFWATGDGVISYKIAQAQDFIGTGAGAISNLLLTADGYVVISGVDSRGCRLNASTRGALICKLGNWNGTVMQLN